MINTRKYIGLPFKDEGRDPSGFDCWGLLMWFYKTELKIDVPDIAISCYDHAAINVGYLDICSNWTQIDEPKMNCMVAFRNHPRHPQVVNHVGVYLGEDTFIHILEMGSILSKVRDAYWKNKLHGFFLWGKS